MPVSMLPVHLPDMRRMGQLNRMLNTGFDRTPQEPKPIEHGTRNAYSNRGCRCDECRRANREYHRQNRKSLPATVPDHLHGKPSTYCHHGCRCDVCRKAATEYRMQFSFRGVRGPDRQPRNMNAHYFRRAEYLRNKAEAAAEPLEIPGPRLVENRQ